MKSAKYLREELEEKGESASVESIRQIQLDAIISALEQVTTDPTPRKRASVILSAIAVELLGHHIPKQP